MTAVERTRCDGLSSSECVGVAGLAASAPAPALAPCWPRPSLSFTPPVSASWPLVPWSPCPPTAGPGVGVGGNGVTAAAAAAAAGTRARDGGGSSALVSMEEYFPVPNSVAVPVPRARPAAEALRPRFSGGVGFGCEGAFARAGLAPAPGLLVVAAFRLFRGLLRGLSGPALPPEARFRCACWLGGFGCDVCEVLLLLVSLGWRWGGVGGGGGRGGELGGKCQGMKCVRPERKPDPPLPPPPQPRSPLLHLAHHALQEAQLIPRGLRGSTGRVCPPHRRRRGGGGCDGGGV